MLAVVTVDLVLDAAAHWPEPESEYGVEVQHRLGFEGIWWTAQSLRHNFPSLFEMYMYTSH